MDNKGTTDDIIIIGAGIVGATMGTLLKKLEPEWDITILDKSDGPGKESLMNGIMPVQVMLHSVN